MVVYYEPQQPVVTSALHFRNTSFALVLRRFDFWAFITFHFTLVILVVMDVIDTDELPELPWQTAATVQFFMTFFITFYTKHCYKRFWKLYNSCTQLLDCVLLFVFELSVSYGAAELEGHRTLATKYVLSAIYILFMGLTGGSPSRSEWKELVRKGLLTGREMEVLSGFPGGKVTFVLCNWAMQIADHALDIDEVFWNRPEEFGGPRQQRIAHPHNRLNNHVVELLATAEDIGNIVAQPIPYQYYHLMNLVLVMNFFLMAFLLAIFKLPITVPIFAVFLLIFLGLREVATQLADPFGQDEVDFPVPQFLNYTFDHAICLLEAFNRMDKQAFFSSVQKVPGFTDEHLRMKCSRDLLYGKTGLGSNREFFWENFTPLSNFDMSEQNLVAYMRRIMKPKLVKKAEAEPAGDVLGVAELQAMLDELAEVREAAEQELKDTLQQATALERFSAERRLSIASSDAGAGRSGGGDGVRTMAASARGGAALGLEPSSAPLEPMIQHTRQAAGVSATVSPRSRWAAATASASLAAASGMLASAPLAVLTSPRTDSFAVAGAPESRAACLRAEGGALGGGGGVNMAESSGATASAVAPPPGAGDNFDSFADARACIRRALESAAAAEGGVGARRGGRGGSVGGGGAAASRGVSPATEGEAASAPPRDRSTRRQASPVAGRVPRRASSSSGGSGSGRGSASRRLSAPSSQSGASNGRLSSDGGEGASERRAALEDVTVAVDDGDVVLGEGFGGRFKDARALIRRARAAAREGGPGAGAGACAGGGGGGGCGGGCGGPLSSGSRAPSTSAPPPRRLGRPR